MRSARKGDQVRQEGNKNQVRQEGNKNQVRQEENKNIVQKNVGSHGSRGRSGPDGGWYGGRAGEHRPECDEGV